ncbi:MAG: penicillin-binding protein activator [Burkholderiales bacterium]|nr:penicillin-binding protein activator [Burkholderiales bacterium]MCA3229322.1 penicillin-binding protein activator [Burkholderiales bacterium]
MAVALLLPAAGTPFARAADVVRQGVFAARAQGDAETALQVIEIDERPESVATAVSRARELGARVVLGPLLRDQAAAAVRLRDRLPMVTLSQPERDADAAPTLLAFGLSIEQEARQIVAAALRLRSSAAGTAPRFVVMVGESPLARRAGLAFRNELAAAGERSIAVPFAARQDTLVAIGESLAASPPDAVLLALDARDAATLRPRLPRELPVFATSMVNLGGAEGTLLAPDLEGVVFIDLPWLLEPDHPAVMVYPRPEQPLSAELQRLYALGIDGYRLALEWAQGRSAFTLDGVTGFITVDRALSARTERRPGFAVFRSGRIERLEVQ